MPEGSQQPQSSLRPQAVVSREVLFSPADGSSGAPRPALLLPPVLGGGAKLSQPELSRDTARVAGVLRAPASGILHGPCLLDSLPGGPSVICKAEPASPGLLLAPPGAPSWAERRVEFWVAKPRRKPRPGGGNGRQSREEKRHDVVSAVTRAVWPGRLGRGGGPGAGRRRGGDHICPLLLTPL